MLRLATLDDIPSVVLLKLKMFQEINWDHLIRGDFLKEVEKSYSTLYENGKAIHFVIQDAGEIIACGGGFIKDDIPYCYFKDGEYGFIGDIYVIPEFRKKGYARMLTNEIINWLFNKGVNTIRLKASDDARKLYASLGFKETDEMVLHK